MAGLADLFGGGGGMFNTSALYGDMLSPEQKQALAWRGLMSAAGALGQAAMPSRMPVPLGAALGQAAGAMAQGQDEGTLHALQAIKLSQQAADLKSQASMRDAFMKNMDQLDPLLRQFLQGDPGAAGAAAMAPAVQAGDDLGGGLRAGGALAPKSGGVTLAEAKAAALRAGFDEEGANTIAAISVPESSLNPNAYNPKDPAGGSFGLTQINGVHPGAREALGNVDKAMELAFRVSKGGKDFKPWAAYTSGAYRPYVAEASRISVPVAGQQDSVIPTGRVGPLTAKDVTTKFGGPKTQKLSDGTLVSEDDYPYPLDLLPPDLRGQAAVRPAQFTPAQPAAPPRAAPLPTFGSLAPGGNANAAQALMLGLSKQNAIAEMLKMGTPYSSMISVLQGSPQYKQSIAEAEARAAYSRPEFNRDLQRALGLDKADIEVDKAWQMPTEVQKNLRAAGIDPNSPRAREFMLRALPDTRPDAVRLAEAAGLSPEASSGVIAGAIPGNAPTPAQKEMPVLLRGTPEEQKAYREIKKFESPQTTINNVVDPIAAGVGKSFVEQREAATNAVNSIAAIHRAREMVDQGMITGPGAEQRAFLSRVGELFGLPAEAAANTATFKAAIGEQVLALVKGMGAGTGISNADREFAERMAGGREELGERAIRQILDIREKAERAKIKAYSTQAERLLSEAPDSVKQIAPLLKVDEPPGYLQPGGGLTTPYGTIKQVK